MIPTTPIIYQRLISVCRRSVLPPPTTPLSFCAPYSKEYFRRQRHTNCQNIRSHLSALANSSAHDSALQLPLSSHIKPPTTMEDPRSSAFYKIGPITPIAPTDAANNVETGSGMEFAPFYEAPDQLYKRGWLDSVEDREEYRPGGFHPVHIGDLLGPNGRYQVKNKLGSGGLATVWFCRDLERNAYVALKIIRADESGEDCAELRLLQRRDIGFKQPGGEVIVLPLDHFQIEGPNGSHLCLVLPALGPRTRSIWHMFPDATTTSRRIARQITMGLQFLHKNGICHGDFRPGNVLLRLANIDDVSEEQLLQGTRAPRQEPMVRISGEAPGPSAPDYLIEPIDLEGIDPKYLTEQACIVDFGESYEVSNPSESWGIPTSYCAPELFFDNKHGVGCDIWSLACTIFEIRSFHILFENFFGDDDEVIVDMVKLLGKLPEPLWSAWEQRESWYHDDGTPKTKEPTVNADTGEPYPKNDTIESLLALGRHYTRTASRKSYDITVPLEERKLLEDLLLKMLRYDPQSRLTLTEALEHPWFKL